MTKRGDVAEGLVEHMVLSNYLEERWLTCSEGLKLSVFDI